MRGLCPALRIARREAVRSKGRSALVIAMIGLPMLGLAFADVAVRTAQLPRSEQARREIGAADLTAHLVANGPITQRGRWDVDVPEGSHLGPNGATAGAPTRPEPDPLTYLPAGSRATPRRFYYDTRAGAGGAVTPAEVEQSDLRDPLARGTFVLRSGAVPGAPGEAAVSPELAEVLGLRVGDAVTIGGVERRVTGLVLRPGALDARVVYLPPGAPSPATPGTESYRDSSWSVALPAGVRDLDVIAALNRGGFRVTPRTWILDPPPEPSDSYVDTEAIGVVVVVVGLAALEIVLLAGAAFAVGARRRQRELALVAATGGDRRDVRRIVLAGGVVLGATAGVLGVVGGIAAVVLARPLLERASGALLGPLDVRVTELGAIVLVGAGTALLAALLPARAAARQPVVSALTGRRADARARGRVPYVAFAAIVAGAALAFWAAGDGQVPAARMDDTSVPVAVGGRPAHFTLLLLGAVIAELGFVACAPALVAAVGRLGGRLPLALRLAARDAARHRTRSGPAVAAVVAAVAGSVAVSVYLASDTEKQRRAYEPRLPSGYVSIGRGDIDSTVSDADLAAALAKLPVRDHVDSFQVAERCDQPGSGCGHWQLRPPVALDCAAGPGGGPSMQCAGRVPRGGHLIVGEPALARLMTGRDDEPAAAALRQGKVVVFDERWLTDGQVTLAYESFTADGAPGKTRTLSLPAVAVPSPFSGASAAALLTPETAKAAGLPTVPAETLVRTTRMPTDAEEAAARGVIAQQAPYIEVYVERGFRPNDPLALLALVVASSVVTVGATGIATGLAAADSRPDLATLAAVGAAPRVRRRLAMAQAATVAALGSVLGILAGLVPAIAIVGARAEVPLELPWMTLATTAVGVPFLAALVIGGCTRSRLPLARRMA